MMRYHDLTITLNEKTLPFIPTDDPHMMWAHRVDHNSFVCQASVFMMPSHMGTHVDAPLHYVPGGKTTAQIDLASYSGEAVCLEVPDFPRNGEFDMAEFLDTNKDMLRRGDILILSTGYENMVGTQEYFEFPDFADSTGILLEQYGIKALGMDSPTLGQRNRVHYEVLSRNIVVIESLINLKPLIGRRFFFSAVPLKFEDGDGSPVRAYAITED